MKKIVTKTEKKNSEGIKKTISKGDKKSSTQHKKIDRDVFSVSNPPFHPGKCIFHF